MTVKKVKEFMDLKRKLFPDGEMFVVMDESDPDVIRYNELAGDVIPWLARKVEQYRIA